MLCTIIIQKLVQQRGFILYTVIDSVEYFFSATGNSNWQVTAHIYIPHT